MSYKDDTGGNKDSSDPFALVKRILTANGVPSGFIAIIIAIISLIFFNDSIVYKLSLCISILILSILILIFLRPHIEKLIELKKDENKSSVKIAQIEADTKKYEAEQETKRELYKQETKRYLATLDYKTKEKQTSPPDDNPPSDIEGDEKIYQTNIRNIDDYRRRRFDK